MKNKNEKQAKNPKNLMFVLFAIMLTSGFVVVGAHGNTNIEDRQADNTEQVRAFAPPGAGALNTLSQSIAFDCHSHQRCYVQSSRRNKNKDQDKKNRQANRKARLTWKEASCSRSKGLKDWARTMKFNPKTNRSPGTKFQKRAYQVLGLKTPFEAAKRIVDELIFRHIQNGESIQKVLNEESKLILEADTRRIRDPSIRMDYLNTVLRELGPALGAGDATTRQALTLTPDNIVAVMRYIHSEGTLYRMSFNYELEVRPFTIAKGVKGITPIVNTMLYGRNNTPFMKLIRQKAEGKIDDYIKEIEANGIDHAANAPGVLKTYTQIFKDMAEGSDSAREKFAEIPTEYVTIVTNIRDAVLLLRALPDGDNKNQQMAEAERLNKLFVAEYVKNQQSTDLTREQHLQNLTKDLKEKAVAENRESRHSWEIRILRKVGNKTEVTLQWHLSHMSQYREKGKDIIPNNHEGAKYLFGPSNHVRMPQKVDRGYVTGAEAMVKHGSTPYYGDAASLQAIMFSSQTHRFDVRKDMKPAEVAKVNERRNNHKALYTLTNVVLGASHQVPGNESYRLAGLCTHPNLLKEGQVGQMNAVALDSWEARSSNNNRNTNPNAPGPNQRKNREAAKLKAEAARKVETQDSANAEEIELYKPGYPSSKDKKTSLEVFTPPAPHVSRETLTQLTVSQLKDELKKNDLKFSGKKDVLVTRLFEHYGGLELSDDTLEDLTLFLATYGLENNPVYPAPKKPKKRNNAPKASRNGKNNS